MAQQTRKHTQPSCLHCGHDFSAAEIAAITNRRDEGDTCIIECSRCGRYNEVRSEPRPGFGAQPVLVVRAVRKSPGRRSEVFRESVEPGIDAPPEVKGTSNRAPE